MTREKIQNWTDREGKYTVRTVHLYYNFRVGFKWAAFVLVLKCRYLFQCCAIQHCRITLFLVYLKQHSKWTGFFICWNVILSFSYISYYPLSKQKWQWYNALLRPNLRWKVLKYECKYETETPRISAKTEQWKGQQFRIFKLGGFLEIKKEPKEYVIKIIQSCC